jgi:hypothetical protein
MLFIVFKIIMDTIWGMDDANGPAVAAHVYRELFRSKELDLEVIPYALDDATGTKAP